MKAICIAGRLGKDSELRRTQKGDAVLGFSVAVDDGYGDSKRTLWFECSLFGKRGQSLESALTKGKQVTVSGDFSTREYEGKTFMTVNVNDVTLQGGGNERQQAAKSSYDEPDNSRRANDLDDEIPFIMEWR